MPSGAFNWALVAENYARALRRYVRQDPALRAELETAVAEDHRDFAKRFSPGFDQLLLRQKKRLENTYPEVKTKR